MLDYASGEMHEEARRTFEAHLESCPECRRELAQMSAILGLVGSQEDIEPTPDEVRACVALADKSLKPLAPAAGLRRWAARATDHAFAAACLAVFALAAGLMRVFNVAITFDAALDFAFNHQIAVGVVCGVAVLVTCFVPIVMHAQRRTGMLGEGG
jgi:anti-sigma factor RsiW